MDWFLIMIGSLFVGQGVVNALKKKKQAKLDDGAVTPEKIERYREEKEKAKEM